MILLQAGCYRRLVSAGRPGRGLFVPVFLVCFCLFFAMGDALAAGFPPEVQVVSARNGAEVMVNRQVVLVVRAPADGKSPEQRAQEIARRLSGLSEPQQVAAVPINRKAIALETQRGRLIMVITKADASAEKTALGPLARRWAATLDKALSLPPLALGAVRSPLVVPTGETRSVVVGGAAPANAIDAQDHNQAVTQSRFDPATRRVTVQGKVAGEAVVEITATAPDGTTAQKILPVIVEDPAAGIDREGSARVTGSPAAPRALVIQAVYNALYRMIRPERSARIELLESPDVTQDLPAGQSMTVAVPLRAQGPGLVSVEAKPTVTITNDDTLPKLTATDLFYSNDPERVTKPQPLFTATLPPLSRPARLIYHHMNVSGAPLSMTIQIYNRGATDATLDILQGRAGPADDPIETGFESGKQFLQALQDHDTLVLAVPAGSCLTLAAERVPNGQTVSGYVEMAQLGDQASDLVLAIAAQPVAADPPSPLDTLVHPINGEAGAYPVGPIAEGDNSPAQFASMSGDIYESPNILVPASYAVGGRWLYLNLGTARMIARKGDSRDRLAGNYGVVTDFSITLSNPGRVPRDIAIRFLAQAGIAAGVFLVDNTQWVVLEPSDGIEKDVARVTLAPGESRTVEIETMPLSGSAYPVSLIAHAL